MSFISDATAKFFYQKHNFVIGNEVNERLIFKTYLPQNVLATTASDNTYRVWTPHIWAVRDEPSCNTYLYATSSPYFLQAWPLYWPNIFEDGKVCYASSDLIPTSSIIKNEHYNIYSDSDKLIDDMVNDFFVSKYHYFDNFLDNIPTPYRKFSYFDYWTKEEYWDDQQVECECSYEDGVCYCESPEPADDDIGMYKVDEFFDFLESSSKLQISYAMPSIGVLSSDEIIYQRLKHYWWYVERVLKNKSIFFEAADIIRQMYPQTDLANRVANSLGQD